VDYLHRNCDIISLVFLLAEGMFLKLQGFIGFDPVLHLPGIQQGNPT
jgi:hypothetical protein